MKQKNLNLIDFLFRICLFSLGLFIVFNPKNILALSLIPAGVACFLLLNRVLYNKPIRKIDYVFISLNALVSLYLIFTKSL